MKVALFVHCFFPDHFYGTETYTLQLAQDLQALGHEVVVVAGVFQGEPRRAELVTRYDYAGISVVAIDKNFEPHTRIRETYWQETMRPHFRALLSDLKPDVVHVTHLVNHTAVLLEEAKSAGYPLVGTLTDFFGFCFNNRLEAANGSSCTGPNMLRSNCIACFLKAISDRQRQELKVLNRVPFGFQFGGLALRLAGLPRSVVPDIVRRPSILHRAYDAYDAMIAPTRFLRGEYVRNGFDPNRVTVSRFGVDLDRSPKPVRPSGTPLIVGFIGQIAAHKGVDILVQAARSVPAGQICLRVYGPHNQDPAYMARLRMMAGPETKFLGTFPPAQIGEVLAGIDLLAVPSRWHENSPLVLLNALASHTPVLVSNVAGLTEFVTDEKDGWCFRRGDCADLARRLAFLAANPQRCRELSNRTTYERTVRSMTEDVVSVYEYAWTTQQRGRDHAVTQEK
jgi:glycosyltransferase involved in cell wall biosynthesis